MRAVNPWPEKTPSLPWRRLSQEKSHPGKVTIRHTEPRRGGSIRCGCTNTASRYSPMRAGDASVAQMRTDENPGRAGSPRTSGEGPSAMASDFPSSSSMVTMRRTGLSPLSMTVPRPSVLCRRLPHHDEGHEAAAVDVAPSVPIAELHNHVPGFHHHVAMVKGERALSRQQNSVIDCRRLVHRRAEEILPAAIPDTVGTQPCRTERLEGRILRRIVIRGLAV